MKNLLSAIFITLIGTSVFAQSSFTCSSNDFSPSQFTGQSLVVTFEGKKVTSVEKIKGSAASCDSTKVLLPTVSTENAAAVIYDVNFCRESNGRLIVPRDFATVKKLNYGFTDFKGNRSVNILKCL